MITRLRATVLASAALLALLAPAARADVVFFGLDISTSGGLPNKIDSSKPSLTVSLEDTAMDEVTVTFDATNLHADNFVTGVWLNFDGDATGLTFSSVSSQFLTALTSPGQTLSGGPFQLNAGLFSMQVAFQNDPSADRFSGGETAFVVLTGSGLRATDFLLTSIDKPAPDPSTGGFYAVARVAGIQLPSGQTGPGVTATRTFTLTVVPEPSSITLLALGGLGLAAVRFRRIR